MRWFGSWWREFAASVIAPAPQLKTVSWNLKELK